MYRCSGCHNQAMKSHIHHTALHSCALSVLPPPCPLAACPTRVTVLRDHSGQHDACNQLRRGKPAHTAQGGAVQKTCNSNQDRQLKRNRCCLQGCCRKQPTPTQTCNTQVTHTRALSTHIMCRSHQGKSNMGGVGRLSRSAFLHVCMHRN